MCAMHLAGAMHRLLEKTKEESLWKGEKEDALRQMRRAQKVELDSRKLWLHESSQRHVDKSGKLGGDPRMLSSKNSEQDTVDSWETSSHMKYQRMIAGK
ncbi:hypothetical protein RB195_019482 [Necator americanus]|uniref:Uncharacterized protein n=1 Tax=Necator americanus TaxID=51031 RepID=A0ABR1CHY6_NECAM